MGLILTFLFVLLVPSSLTEDDGLTCTTMDKSALIIGTPSNMCTQMLQQLAEACSDFIWCALNYSKPMCLCNACSEQYAAVNETYNNIKNYNTHQNLSAREKECKDLLFSDDGVEVVRNSYNLVESLWKSANCKCKLQLSHSIVHLQLKLYIISP